MLSYRLFSVMILVISTSFFGYGKENKRRVASPKVDFFTSMEWDLKSDYPRKRYFPEDLPETRDKINCLSKLKVLYDKNDFTQKTVQGAPVIPKIVHHIWLGPLKPPKFFELSQESIKRYLPDWDYKLWTDKEVAEFKLHNQEVYDLSTNYGEKSDIVRYEILHRYGGVYMDVDIICLKPLDPLLQYDVWVGIAPLEFHTIINNAIIGAVPGHPIVQDCIETLKDNWYAYQTSIANADWRVIFTAGPEHFHKSFMRFVSNDSMNIIAFPASYFYPLGLMDRFLGLGVPTMARLQKIESLIKPESFTIHYWGGSWCR